MRPISPRSKRPWPRRCRSGSAIGAWRRTSAPARSRSSRAISNRATSGFSAGAKRQNLALLEFYDIYDAGSTGRGQVLLTYADDTPAMASLNHGLGTLLFMNFSVSEFSTNLARQRIFPAWMQEIVKNITSDEPLPSSSLLGEPITDEVWKSEMEKTPLRKPSGEPLEVKTEAMGERVGISFVPEELGFYLMRGGQAAARLRRQSAAGGKRSAPDRPRAAAGATR